MKFALVNEKRVEAQPGLSAKCPGCENPMVAKCGEIKIWHWAHRGKHNCNYLWENETQWHRDWKNKFPDDWQEVEHRAENGEKHVADVKTNQGWALEFQHSYLKPEERRARDNFYPKLVWVVDGTRRKTDNPQFIKALNNGTRVVPNMNLFKISSDESALLREWADSPAPVFFDFGEGPSLWWFLPKSPNGKREFVGVITRAEFIERHLGIEKQNVKEFEDFLRDFNEIVLGYYSRLPAQSLNQLPPPLIKGFPYWRTKILEAGRLTVLEAVGKALAKYKSQTKASGKDEVLTEDQLNTLRKFYSNKLKLFKEDLPGTKPPGKPKFNK